MKVQVCISWDKKDGTCIGGKKCNGPCDYALFTTAFVVNGKWGLETGISSSHVKEVGREKT